MNLPDEPNFLSREAISQLLASGTNAFRAGTGPSKSSIDYYGGVALVTTNGAAPRSLVKDLVERWEKHSGLYVSAVFHKVAVPNPSGNNVPTLICGDAPPTPHIVQENGMQFLVDFSTGYSTGLFCDQRLNRALVRAEASGKLLNLFAYTGSFSVAGALAGAETTSVDLSKKALAWAQKNFECNGIATISHRFIAEDVLDFLPRLARRGDRFSWIILDSPTFSRGRKGRVFQIAKQLDRLLEGACACAAEDARILISTNSRNLSAKVLAAAAWRAGKAAGFDVEIHPAAPPQDFAPGTHSACVWAHLRKRRL
jgi:23S rRNA (cytosine1962-C5)-methyltransferase